MWLCELRCWCGFVRIGIGVASCVLVNDAGVASRQFIILVRLCVS